MPTAPATRLAIGTKKGLVLMTSRDRRRWRTTGPHFAGLPVHDVMVDPRDGKTVWAALTSEHFGPAVRFTRNDGKTWTEVGAPAFPKDSGLSVAKIWKIAPGVGEGELWAGVEPAALFRSTDGGRSWSGVPALNEHPERKDWYPGGGGLCLHTVLPYPDDAARMLVGASAVGVFGSGDAGRSWRLMNGGIRSGMTPTGKTAEDQHGSCVHKMVRDAKDPDIVYMQNHWGVYRRRRGADRWTDISKGLPSRFGFPMVAHPHDGATVYTVPLEADMNRVTPGGRFAVHRTEDGGRSWTALRKGLPQKDAWFTVLREGLATDGADPAGLYVGTTTGHLFGSRDEGRSWSSLASTLPPIMAVSAGTADGRSR